MIKPNVVIRIENGTTVYIDGKPHCFGGKAECCGGVFMDGEEAIEDKGGSLWHSRCVNETGGIG